MYIKRETKMVITEEEREILNKAREILMDFEDESSSADENTLQDMYDEFTLQDMYDEFTDCVDHQMALPTAIDLLTTILGDNDL